MRAIACVVVFALIGCASSNTGRPDADPGEPDASPPADAAIDGPPLKGFSEPCTDNSQCESNLCILVGTSGQCTQNCSGADCPPGYGCLGVEGISIDGQITLVCVPTSNQLCTTCTQDSECTLIGMDKCVTYPDGDRACARDCATVGCPMGFECETVAINGVNYQQCMAESGACDCTAANPGAMQPCNIPTPWNVCLGAQTCNGGNGWSTCAPPSAVDDPDATYTDDNCDGIDGDVTRGIFVAGGGANTSTCGLTYQTPCATISHGIVRATTSGRQHVYVQTGTYTEVVVLVNGVNVWGGYDFNWQRGPHSDPAHRVTIVGAQDNGVGGSGEFMTIRARSVFVPATIGDLVIRGPLAAGQAGASGRDGRSSYAIYSDGSQITLVRVRIEAGSGAGGGAGGNGLDAVVVDVQGNMNGGNGGDGDEFNTACNDSSRGGGGPAGTNSCSGSPSSRATNGGAGGRGGTMDEDCSFPPEFSAQPGAGGAAAVFSSFPYGVAGGAGGTCGNAGFGNDGLVANGNAGGAITGGYLSGSFWYANGGGSGGTGQNGSGGGGGGGSGGCDDGTDAYGAGGGGGGAGGCAARGGGGGGGGGGSSIGLLAVNSSSITITTCDLVRGNGGNGGTGGTGGRGQTGGNRGIDGQHPGSGAAGVGGRGAHGGHGGGGGGGAGGRSVGLMWTPGSTVTHNCTIAGGAPGNGGTGGLSAPNAPLAERDGNNGSTGASGTLDGTRACPSATSC